MSCRHHASWVICGGYFCWCPDCGAIRKMIRTGEASIEYLWTRWIYPNGVESTRAALERQRERRAEE